MSNSTKTTSGGSTQKSIAARFDAAADLRLTKSGLDLKDLAKAMQMDPSTLLAKRKGHNKLFYQDIELADDFFTLVGLPGLIEDMKEQRGWTHVAMPLEIGCLSPAGRRLLACIGGMRDAGAALQSFLAEKNLLAHVHIMARADNAVRVVHCGEKMASAKHLSRSILLRDVRDLSDRSYGLFLHTDISQLLQNGEPVLHRITSPTMRYRRLAVPIEQFLVAVSDQIDVQQNYVLR